MTATQFNDKMAASVTEPKEKAPAKIYAETVKTGVLYQTTCFWGPRRGNKPFSTVYNQFIIMAVPTGINIKTTANF